MAAKLTEGKGRAPGSARPPSKTRGSLRPLQGRASSAPGEGRATSRGCFPGRDQSLADATGEIYGAAAFYRYFATLDLPAKVVTDDATSRIEVRRKPLGVVGCIIPWNFPMILMAFKVAASWPAIR